MDADTIVRRWVRSIILKCVNQPITAYTSYVNVMAYAKPQLPRLPLSGATITHCIQNACLVASDTLVHVPTTASCCSVT